MLKVVPSVAVEVAGDVPPCSATGWWARGAGAVPASLVCEEWGEDQVVVFLGMPAPRSLTSMRMFGSIARILTITVSPDGLLRWRSGRCSEDLLGLVAVAVMGESAAGVA